MSNQQQQPEQSSDGVSDALDGIVVALLQFVVGLIVLPLLVPFLVTRISGEAVAIKTRFWVVHKWQWAANLVGAILWASLIAYEVALLTEWISSGHAKAFMDTPEWWNQLLPTFGPWALINIASGVLLLPLAWSMHRRRIASRVRRRQISDVVRQERIESARKRAGDVQTAASIGVKVDPVTGAVLATTKNVVTAPHTIAGGRNAFGISTRATVTNAAERFQDVRRVRDWADPKGRYLVLPDASSSVRALVIAESGSGKTVLLNGLVLCALINDWPVFFIDAKGDPDDAEKLATIVGSYGRTAAAGGRWNLFGGTAEQVSKKLMHLLPETTGDGAHYRNEAAGIIRIIQTTAGPVRSIADLQERLERPSAFVGTQQELTVVDKQVERDGTTAGQRVLQSLLVALYPLEPWISEDGWSFDQPAARLTIASLSPVDEAQAKLGSLMLLDLRNFLTERQRRRDKSPMVVVVDEFAQLITGINDPAESAAPLFEVARSAGVGLVLASQSTAGLSTDEGMRKRLLSSGAALIIGRSKDPEGAVEFAGTVMRMEASGAAGGEELRSARAQHTYVIPPMDVRNAADGAFWMIQGGAVASFRALPNRNVRAGQQAGMTGTTAAEPARPAELVEL